MDATHTSITTIAKAIEDACHGRWAVWLSDTGRWWAARHGTLTAETVNAGCVQFLRADSPAELKERIRGQDELHTATGRKDKGPRTTTDSSESLPGSGDNALNDLRHAFGDRWHITPIKNGYRALIRDPGEHLPVPLYGRTPAELAESIRMAEGSL